MRLPADMRDRAELVGTWLALFALSLVFWWGLLGAIALLLRWVA